MDRLVTLLKQVSDEQTFLEFARALAADSVTNLPDWENQSIELYLDAALAWADDSDFGRRHSEWDVAANPWGQFARFLYTGKIYE